jgi:hypothetical protein
MDETVLAAMAKWPNVPACYGWLELDARGHWRLGATDATHREIVRHAGLQNFLGRNYSCTEHGEWFCQNGPQRAYVTLAAAPWVIHYIDGHWYTHTGAMVHGPQVVLIDERGRVFFAMEQGLGIVDDRDLPTLIGQLTRLNGDNPDDDSILDALANGHTANIALAWNGHFAKLQSVESSTLERRFNFVRAPLPPTTSA